MPMKLSFGTPEANKAARQIREETLSLEFLEAIENPTEAELELLDRYDELRDEQDQFNYTEIALAIAKVSLQEAKIKVMEEQQA